MGRGGYRALGLSLLGCSAPETSGPAEAAEEERIILPDLPRAFAPGEVIELLPAYPNTTCVVRAPYHLYCWGLNECYRFGEGTMADAILAPRRIAFVPPSDSYSMKRFGCRIAYDSRVYCWGWCGETREAGYPKEHLVEGLPPVKVVEASTAWMVTEESLYFGFGMAIAESGDVYRWFIEEPGHAAEEVESLRGATQLATTCALEPHGGVQCWGTNNWGQVGDGTFERRLDPVPVAGLDDAVYVSSGVSTVCAVRRGGAVVCWGDNGTGNLGLGGTVGPTVTESPIAVEVEGLPPVRTVAVSQSHACALDLDGRVWCWGGNWSGATGAGGTQYAQHDAILVAGLEGVTQIAVAWFHSCALSGGVVYCWGAGHGGALGNGSNDSRSTPTEVVWED